jgi:hypothetical protein
MYALPFGGCASPTNIRHRFHGIAFDSDPSLQEDGCKAISNLVNSYLANISRLPGLQGGSIFGGALKEKTKLNVGSTSTAAAAYLPWAVARLLPSTERAAKEPKKVRRRRWQRIEYHLACRS